MNCATPHTIVSNIQVIMSESGRPCYTDMFEKLLRSTIAIELLKQAVSTKVAKIAIAGFSNARERH